MKTTEDLHQDMAMTTLGCMDFFQGLTETKVTVMLGIEENIEHEIHIY